MRAHTVKFISAKKEFPLKKKDFPLTKNSCFLCEEKITPGNYSKEHHFPRWLLRKYGLHNKTLILPNQTDIPYNRLTIPCCSFCNQNLLRPLEDIISKAVKQGVTEIRNLDQKLLFQWLSKIFYGALYKDMFLQLERSKPSSETIISPELLESLKMHHLFLKSLFLNIQWVDFTPWSIFIFKVNSSTQAEEFWYGDNLPTSTMAIKMGEIGIVAALQDNHITSERLSSYYRKISKQPLLLTEFVEFFSFVATAVAQIRGGKKLSGVPRVQFQ